jgi:hypothetical protein
MAKEFNPDDLSFVGKPGGVTQPMAANQIYGAPAPMQKPPINEVGAIDENSVIDISEVPDELPEMEPLPEGTYDCSLDSIKIKYNDANRMTLWVSFKPLNPAFAKRFISWFIAPETAYGKTHWRWLISRGIKTDPVTGDQYALAQKVNKLSFRTIVDSGVMIGARIRITGKPETRVAEKGVHKGEPRTYFTITKVELPKQASFL